MSKYHIQTITVPSGGASAITFSNIPQIYDDLVVVISGRSSVVDIALDCFISFNGSTSGFSARQLYGYGATVASNTTARQAGGFPGGLAAVNTFSNLAIYIPNYRSSVAKSYSVDSTAENNTETSFNNIVAGLWSGTDAINGISFISGASGSLTQHSSASLYGIKRGSDGRTEVASGGTITTSGGFTIHTFNTSGTFVANRNLGVECLVVAGGGGGRLNSASGGGGAGGYLTGTGISLSANSSYAVIVGGGGAVDADGSISEFASLRALGGGRGAGPTAASSGGSGGGGSNEFPTPGSGAAGQGNSGGAMFTRGGYIAAGGGGGAGAVGGNGTTNNTPGNGGAGLTSSISGTAVGRAGGGGGGLYNEGNQGTGGTASDGGGAGGRIYGNGASRINATPGTANTGGGGGGGGGSVAGQNSTSGTGGSGVVIIRYPTPA